VELSARNQPKGTVKSITLGGIMAEVTIRLADDQEIVSAVTKRSLEMLGLREGNPAIAVIKATDVLVGKPCQ
jgi:molybdate transport system regulatory protein